MNSNYMQPQGGRPLPVQYQTAAELRTEGSSPMADYYSAFVKRIWTIALFIGVGMCATYAVSTRLTPVYEATATIELDRDNPSGIVGDQAVRTSYTPDDDLYMATQMKLVQVDSVIRPVAEKFHLAVRKGKSKSGNGPIELDDLKVKRVPNTHLLQIHYSSADPVLASGVANSICEGYLDNYYANRLRSMETMSHYAQQQLDELKAKMEHSSLALGQYERELDLVNPEQKTTLAGERVVQLNDEYTKAQVERIHREAEFNLARSETLDSAEASTLSDPLHKLIERRNDAQEKFSQTKEHYGTEHPEYRRGAAQLAELNRQIETMRQSIGQRHRALYEEAANREAMVDESLKDAKIEADRVNQKAFEYQRLRNEADSDKKLYEQLAQRVKEADVNSAFRNDAIRIVEKARAPEEPVFPQIPLNLALALVVCASLGTVGAVAADKMKPTLSNAQHARAYFSLGVIGELPIVKRRSRLRAGTRSILGLSSNSANAPRPIDNARANEAAAFVEAARSIRNTLALWPNATRMRTVLITSALPREGKTTTALHLAILNAKRGRRTLLIDADFHRPSVHRALDIPNSRGLADFVNGSADWKANLVRVGGIEPLDILPAGVASPTTIERGSDRLLSLLEEAASIYELVIVDGPPILACSEVAPLAVAADGVLVVAEANSTKRVQVRNALNVLATARANVVGLVLNKVAPGECTSGGSYYYYSKAAK